MSAARKPKAAPSAMWVEVSIGVSLKAGPPRGQTWTIASLAARHEFDEAAVVRAIDALADEGVAEAVSLKAEIVAASLPAACAPVAAEAEGAAPRDSDVPAPSVDPIPEPRVSMPLARDPAGGVAEAASPALSAPAISIGDAVAAEASAAGRRRVAARSTGSLAGATLSPLKVRIETEMLRAPEDGFAFLRRKWPDLLARVVAEGHAECEAPGPMLARVIEAGLECLTESRSFDQIGGTAA